MPSYGLVVPKIRMLVAQHLATVAEGKEKRLDPATVRHHKHLDRPLLRCIPNKTQQTTSYLHCRSLELCPPCQQSRQYFVRAPVLMAPRIH